MLTRADVLVMLVVLPVLIMLAGLWVHRPVRLNRMLWCPWWCRVLSLRLRMRGPLWGDDPSGCKELVNGGTQVGHLGRVQRPVVELSLSHALLQTWQRGRGNKDAHHKVSLWASSKLADKKIYQNFYFSLFHTFTFDMWLLQLLKLHHTLSVNYYSKLQLPFSLTAQYQQI